MARIAKRHGVSVYLHLDGQGGESDLMMTCDQSVGYQSDCKFAQGMSMIGGRLDPDYPCCFKADGQCCRLAAQLDALKRAKSVIAAQIKEVEEELDNAD